MNTVSQQNAVIARNIAFWRDMHDLTPQGAVRGTSMAPKQLAAYEAGEEPVLATDLFELATAWGVPAIMFTIDYEDGIYKDSEESELRYKAWSLIQFLSEQGDLGKTIEFIHQQKVSEAFHRSPEKQ